MAIFGKGKKLKELEVILGQTQAQLQRLQEDRDRFENISRMDKERVVDLTDENKRLKTEVQRLQVLERALQELQAIQEREKQAKEAIAELIVGEDTIISLIQQAKQVLAEIINLLRFVLDKHPDLIYRVHDYTTEYKNVPNTERRESVPVNVSIRNVEYTLRHGAYSWDTEKKMHIVFISIAGTFMVLYNAVDRLMLLVKEEKRNAAIVKKYDEFVINFMNKMYSSIYNAVYRSLPSHGKVMINNYLEIDTKTMELSEDEMKYITKQGSKVRVIMELNDRIHNFMVEILSTLDNLRKIISGQGDNISRIYPEFSRIKGNLLVNLQKLFIIFINHINKNQKLADRIVLSTGKSLVEAQQQFNSFLRHVGDNFDDSIRQMEFDFRR